MSTDRCSGPPRLAVLLLGLLGAGLPGCIVFGDTAGVPLEPILAEEIQPGWTREEVLELVGPPTGVYSQRLLELVGRLNSDLDEFALEGRRDDDVLTWQQVDVRARVVFFPILFAVFRSRINTKTLMVLFDEDGLVTDVAWREDSP